MQGRFGFDETTPDKLQLDAGEFWANFDIETFLADAQDEQTDVTDLADYGLNDEDAIRLGATEGGGSFDANRDRNEIEFDGSMGRTKGMVRRESVEPELSVELMEFTQQNLELAIAGAETNDIDDEGITDVIEITGGEIKTTDYIDNVVFIGKRSDGKPVMFEIRNLLVEALSLDTDHSDEGTFEVNFQAHFDVEECEIGTYGEKIFIEPWRLVMYADDAA